MEQGQSGKIGTRWIIAVILIGSGAAWYFYGHQSSAQVLSIPPVTASSIAQTETPQTVSVAPPAPTVTHIATPAQVNGIYISSWSAGTPSSMAHINTLLAGGKLNSVVIDIKDATGRISYQPLDPTLVASGAGTKRIRDIQSLITSLHDRNIYVIGRISVFQDQYYPTIHPEAALQDSVTHGPWKDPKGLMYLQENNPDVWHYTESIAEDAYAQGFDEINVDYVRFPSDGKLKDIDMSTFTASKQDTIASFFADLDTTLRQKDHIPLSADVFGLTVSATDDMGIGQKMELIAPHVDYICPMIYPSHFADGAYGYAKPAEHPYDIIHKALLDGKAKLTAAGISTDKLRPWLQDFNLGAIYTADMVQAQIDAAHDEGIDARLTWDAGNRYTASVYK